MLSYKVLNNIELYIALVADYKKPVIREVFNLVAEDENIKVMLHGIQLGTFVQDDRVSEDRVEIRI